MTTVEQAGQFIPDGHFPDDLDGFCLFRFTDAQILTEGTDITTYHGKDHHDKAQHNTLKIFHLKIDAFRPINTEEGNDSDVCQQGKNTYIQKTSGIETEDTKEEDNNVNQQQDRTCLIGKIHYIHYKNDGSTHLDDCQTWIGHFQIQTGAQEYIQGNVDSDRAGNPSEKNFPFNDAGKIGEITKKRAYNVGGKCHQKTANAQRLFWIILGEDWKMDKVDKSFLFHVSEYMKNDFVSQDDFDRSIRPLYFCDQESFSSNWK